MANLKVLIVDDEKPARELLNRLIDWNELGFEVCGEAKNGKEAYEMYIKMKPDIIITDIQMPIMTGLELIKKIREADSEQRFIILSCYEEFSFAREAVRMNVEDYLIKDLLKKEDIIQLLLSVYVNKVQAVKQRVKEDEKAQIKNNEKLIGCIDNQDNVGISECLQLEQNINYAVLIVSIDDYYSSKMNYKEYAKEKIKNNLTSTLERFNDEQKQKIIQTFAYIGNGKFIVIVIITSDSSESFKLKNSFNIVNNLRAAFSTRDQQHTISISISRDFQGVDSFKERYVEANEVLKYRLFLGKEKNLNYNLSIPKLTKMSEQTLKNKIDKIIEDINNNDISKLKKEITDLYKENLSGFMQYNFLKEVNGQLFYLLSNICKQNNITYGELFGINYLPVQMVDQFDTVEEIIEWFIQNFEQAIYIISEKTRYSRRINDAILYIEENYELAISLHDISEALNIHKVYLSRIFKEETGVTISRYILNYRINIAKKLIETTNMKLYEIGEKAGFINSQHFVVCFKKIEGITPKEYRENRKN
ncbi:MAG: hypothetical protein CVV02_07085 [Firmicutes bacterium HGW-Firmicutes-7]|nr:MAG: hypothetical protein CVV02_07085 [Firmicutes bacterium HGW-Firmicutes-7]